jgi:hypothetical protein
MWDVVQRVQYDVVALFPRRIPWWLQIANVGEYADWQVALGVAPEPPPTWLRTSITLMFAAAGIYGSVRHWRVDRVGWRALAIVCLTGSLGVVAYLNLKAGPSFGYGVVPAHAVREARERDYFFFLFFVCWGLWAGYGLVTLARPRWRWGAAGFACLPIMLNWPVIRHERGDESRVAMAQARALLSAVPPRGVFLAVGDNDTYPLWYLQEVYGMRKDVVVVTIPLLGPSWYRQELMRRYGLLSPCMAARWYGVGPTLNDLRYHAAIQHRPVAIGAVMVRRGP